MRALPARHFSRVSRFLRRRASPRRARPAALPLRRTVSPANRSPLRRSRGAAPLPGRRRLRKLVRGEWRRRPGEGDAGAQSGHDADVGAERRPPHKNPGGLRHQAGRDDWGRIPRELQGGVPAAEGVRKRHVEAAVRGAGTPAGLSGGRCGFGQKWVCRGTGRSACPPDASKSMGISVSPRKVPARAGTSLVFHPSTKREGTARVDGFDNE
mmetsp:Transcript_56029/g.167736  ORF Transcript_56029/g.167736 Transcript_56029/m.167736 type:complete len:211 (-) Transcript_56029:592-1224(-)